MHQDNMQKKISFAQAFPTKLSSKSKSDQHNISNLNKNAAKLYTKVSKTVSSLKICEPKTNYFEILSKYPSIFQTET